MKAIAPFHAVSRGPNAAAGDVFSHDRRLQRRAMVSMAAAMATMLVGLPLHVPGLSGSLGHSAALAAGWLSAALASIAITVALPVLRHRGGVPPSLGRGEQALVLCCAAAAYASGWAGLLGGVHGWLYFDVAAMSVAALAEGRALDSDGRRRAVAAAAQLELLSGAGCPDPPVVVRRSTVWLMSVLIVAGAAAAAARAAQAGTGEQSLVAGLATAVACCPCALGRARASAFVAAHALARRDGWIVASAEAIVHPQAWRAAIELPGARRERLVLLGRTARRVARLNVVWACLVPALLLPLALRGPVDPLLPAAAMLVAWSAIGLTNRLLSGDGAVQ